MSSGATTRATRVAGSGGSSAPRWRSRDGVGMWPYDPCERGHGHGHELGHGHGHGHMGHVIIIAMSLPCHCHAIAMPLSSHCRAIAMSLPCHGHARPSWGHVSASRVKELSPRSAINGFLASSSAVCAKYRPKRLSGMPFRGRNLLVVREEFDLNVTLAWDGRGITDWRDLDKA